MLGMGLLQGLFDQEREHAKARGETVPQNRTEDPEVWIDAFVFSARAYREEREAQKREESWENFKDFFKLVFIALCVVAMIVGSLTLSRPQRNRHPDTAVPVFNASQQRGEGSVHIVYHYNMSRADFQDYQYQTALRDIDEIVSARRMQNTALAAQRQAVVECRGGTEWLALPGVQFVDTRVPCSLGVKP